MYNNHLFRTLIILCVCTLLFGAQLPVSAQAAQPKQGGEAVTALPGAFLLHITNAGNVNGDATFLDHPLLNGQSSTIFFVTQNWNPNGMDGQYNNRPIGVYYDSPSGKWIIYNEDNTVMQTGLSFNVYIPVQDDTVFVHQATAGNRSGNLTYIDNSLTNNNPQAVLLVTQLQTATSGVYNNYEVGVVYAAAAAKWAIYNPDPAAAMPVDAVFNVLVASPDEIAYLHVSDAGNTSDDYTLLNHQGLNANPNAFVMATPRRVEGDLPTYNNHALGVWYSSEDKAWSIYNQDMATMVTQVGFNVLVAPYLSAAYKHVATSWNTPDYVTYLDHPLLNHNPYATVIVTQNYGSGVYNPNPIGVWYYGSGWAIYNENLVNIPVGASFNVYIAPYGSNVWTHVTHPGNTSGSYTVLSNPLLDAHMDALILFSHSFDPWNMLFSYDTNELGAYNGSVTDRWTIFHYGGAAMQSNLAYNVVIPPGDSIYFAHTAAPGNTADNATELDNAIINGDPWALIFVSKNRVPGVNIWVDNPHPIGVYYDSSTQHWYIFNQDLAGMPVASSYNVMILNYNHVFLPAVMRP